MSFSKTKTSRFNENQLRPSTSLRNKPNQNSSNTLNNRSHSQHSSRAFAINDQELMDPMEETVLSSIQFQVPNSDILDNIMMATDISVTSEEFKDALDEHLHLKDAAKNIPKICPMTRKNSSSGIPRAVSAKMSRNSVKSKSRNTSPAKSITRSLNASPSSIPRKTCSSPTTPSSPQPNRRILELQFTSKKKKLEQLKRDIHDKYKPMQDLHQTLETLKKKLDNFGGKPVVLDPLKLFGGEVAKKDSGTEVEGGGEQLKPLVEIDPDVLVNMRTSIKRIPASLLAVCKSVMCKRDVLLDILQQYSNPDADRVALIIQIKAIQDESESLEQMISDIFQEQENIIEGLIEKWTQLLHSSSPESPSKMMQMKVKKQENEIIELTIQLDKAKMDLLEKSDNHLQAHEDQSKLYEKIHQLEKQHEAEKRKHMVEMEKYRNTETNLKAVKTKIKDFDTSKQHYDSRISQLSQDLRNAQLKLKSQEKNYEKEIADLNKSRHLDKSVIEKLNKDKSTFEIRIQSAADSMDTMRITFEERIEEMRKEVENARTATELLENEKREMRRECEEMALKVNKLELQTQQAVDLMASKAESQKNCPNANLAVMDTESTDRENELTIEVLAQRATIRSLQDKLDTNATEKLRFISTIERMGGTSVEMSDSVVKALVKKEEDITRFHTINQRNEELIERQKVEIEKLYANQKSLLQQMQETQDVEGSDEIKHMLKDGRMKLEQALLKSLENEHKLIKYEHEAAQKVQAITNLENMLKVRDGLIGVIKAKKDELAMENQSLTKYSEEIRNYVLEAKEDLSQKGDLIIELQSTIDQRTKDKRQLERHVADLEEKLTMTNQRRYKLQDTVSVMEKELQSTKARNSRMEDMQTRPRNKFLRT